MFQPYLKHNDEPQTIFGRFFSRFLQHLFGLNPAGRRATAAVNSVVMCLRFVVRASSKFSQKFSITASQYFQFYTTESSPSGFGAIFCPLITAKMLS